MVSTLGSTGRAAVAAGVLMTAGIEGEWLLNPQQDNGAVTDKPGFALLLSLSTIGFALLFTAIRGLRSGSEQRTRPARVGASLSLAGAGFLTAFAACALVSGLAQDSVLEVTFVLFVLGMLLLAVGPVMWGISLRRSSPAAGVSPALVTSGIGAFALLALPMDPWHDVSMVVMFAAWATLGFVLLRRSTDRAPQYI